MNTVKKPVVIFKNVFLSFGKKEVLKDLSFEIYPREIVSIIGVSGSGKSTILKLITGLLAPDSGEIKVNAERFGMAFQYAALFNSMTVRENIELALRETTHLHEKEIQERVCESLKIVGMENTDNSYPEELSGGMKKRISIARALALKPEILLYDEPSTGLDPLTASNLERDMVILRDKTLVTSIVVTHDIDTLKTVSDRVLILDSGSIVWEGTKKDFFNDKSKYTLTFKERRANGISE